MCASMHIYCMCLCKHPSYYESWTTVRNRKRQRDNRGLLSHGLLLPHSGNLSIFVLPVWKNWSVNATLLQYFKMLNMSLTDWSSCILVDLADIVPYFSIIGVAWLTLFLGFSHSGSSLTVSWCCSQESAETNRTPIFCMYSSIYILKYSIQFYGLWKRYIG